ncbi:MAG: YggT family protein [Rickettsiales bacterium]|nr:YggT family protein [Rickettsiales bacterium]
MNPISYLLYQIISLYFYVVMAWVIMSMLISFQIINRYQPLVSRIFQVLEQMVQPVLRPLRERLPLIAGFDLSPLVLFLGLQFIQRSIVYFS